jgi:hypothetical protein
MEGGYSKRKQLFLNNLFLTLQDLQSRKQKGLKREYYNNYVLRKNQPNQSLQQP